jgi:translation initiation factor IF-2
VLQAPDKTKAKSVVEYRLEKGERDRMAQDIEAINKSRKAEQEKRGRKKYKAVIAVEAKAANNEVAPSTTVAKPSGPKEVYFIVKGDVSGSVKAVIDFISALGNKEV